MGEHYIRTVNLELARFVAALDSSSDPRFHGIVNELAFRLFVRTSKEGRLLKSLTESEITASVLEAKRFIESFRQHGRGRVPKPGEAEIRESIVLAQRMKTFFDRVSVSPLIFQPIFTGCGWLNECEGDILSSNVLYEIKSGERTFRMLDVKQLLVYCALNFSAKSYDIAEVSLVNPREGTYFSEPLNRLCELLSGQSAMEVLGDIVEYISESTDQYGAG